MIEMIAGVFGLPVDGIVKAMDKKSGPFKASAEQEARLVKLGLAKFVDEPAGEKIAPIGFDEAPSDPDVLPDGVTGIPVYSAEMKVSELREIGKMCGLTFKVGMTKEEMVSALDEYIDANMAGGMEVAEDGEITVDDGEPEPTFDASEAVL